MNFLQILMLVGIILMGIWVVVCLKGCERVFIRLVRIFSALPRILGTGFEKER